MIAVFEPVEGVAARNLNINNTIKYQYTSVSSDESVFDGFDDLPGPETEERTIKEDL